MRVSWGAGHAGHKQSLQAARWVGGMARRVRSGKEKGGARDALRLRFPGRVLLSRDAYGHSTIGAEGLNCRVRDGNGCFTLAMATGNFADRERSDSIILTN